MPSHLKKQKLIQRLQEVLPAESLLTSEEDCKVFASDWTKLPGQAMLVVLPKTTEQVAHTLRTCSELEISVVPSGGRTGLSAGAVAREKEQVVLSLSKMNHIGPVDTLGRTLRVQAGAVTQMVHEQCAKEGLLWPIDLASKGTCEIGGNLATNAGGLRVIRYGMARKWVSGLQIVTLSGEVIELNRGLEKNNTGYDLIQLMIGSEGTLAVITEATLKLVPLPQHEKTFLFSFPDLLSVGLFFDHARKGPFEILAFEFLSALCLKAVQEKCHRQSKLQRPGNYYVVMEIETTADAQTQSQLESWLEQMLSFDFILDGMMANSSQDKKEIWGLREGITESLALTGEVRKYDTCVAVKQTVDFVAEAEQLFKQMKLSADLYLFGHFGDGSPHLNIVKHKGIESAFFQSQCDAFEKALYPLLKKWDGTASSEHGVGLLKKDWVTFSRSETELALFRGIKRVFDPQNLLNPGKIF